MPKVKMYFFMGRYKIERYFCYNLAFLKQSSIIRPFLFYINSSFNWSPAPCLESFRSVRFPPPPHLLAGTLYTILFFLYPSPATARLHCLQRQLIDAESHFPVARRLSFLFIFGIFDIRVDLLEYLIFLNSSDTEKP